MRNERNSLSTVVMPALLVLTIAMVAVAESVEIPNAFEPGTVADANAVNANFQALADAVNDNDARIGDNAGSIATNAANISATQATVSAHQSTLTNHGARIGTIETGAPVTGLDADLLDGLHANELVRATYTQSATGTDNFSSTSFTSLVSKSVTIPTSGILLMWGTVTAEWDGDSDANTVSWLEGRLTVGGTQVGISMFTELIDNLVGYDDSVMAVQAAAVVSSGTSPAAFEVRIYQGDAYVRLLGSNLMTLFVPFGNAGTQGVLGSGGAGGGARPPSPLDR